MSLPISARESEDTRPASRHRSPPPRQHVDEPEEEGDEGMYASEGEAGGDDTAPAVNTTTTTTAAPHDERAQVEEVNDEEADAGEHAAEVSEDPEMAKLGEKPDHSTSASGADTTGAEGVAAAVGSAVKGNGDKK